MTGRFQRLAEKNRAELKLLVDGQPVVALEGDSLLTAMLANGLFVRESEFGDGMRAGFCLMAACQDCWVWTAAGTRLRACSTLAEEGLSIVTKQPARSWAKNA